MEKKKIILVEDDKMLSTISRMFLLDLGHELMGIYADGASVLAKCEEELPDLIFMDIHISGDMNGIETAQAINAKYNLPIIFFSSDTHHETIQSVIQTNSYGFLQKPVDKNMMNIAIDFAIAKHQYDIVSKNRVEEFVDMLEAIEDAFIIVSNGIITYINEMGLKFFGVEGFDHIVGFSANFFIDEWSQPVFKGMIQNALTDNTLIENFVCTFKDLQGNLIDAKCVGSVVNFKSQRSVALFVKK